MNLSYKIKMVLHEQKFKILTCFIILTNVVNTARILAITPMPWFSHQYFYRPVWTELASRGHEVVLITAHPIPGNHTNIRQIDVSFVNKLLTTPNYAYKYIDQIKSYHDLMLTISDVQLSSPEIQELIYNPKEHFDLIINEYFMFATFSFKKRFNAPLILLSPLDAYNSIYAKTGTPSHELLYSFFRKIHDSPGFFYRINAFIEWVYDFTYFPCYYDRIDDTARKYFGTYYLPVREALDQFDLLFANVNYALQEVRPLSPAVIPLGGGMFLEMTKNLQLTKDLNHFLDGSSEGVIFISFGSYVKTQSMSSHTILTLMEAFSSMPYKILWKSEPLDANILRTVNKTGNVFISKWYPQTKILGHKNVKLFITQGGIQSLEETIVLKTPILVIPFLADQHPNAFRVEKLHLGAQLDINTLTPTILKETIRKILSDKQIRENLEKYSRLLQDQPMKPVDRAVWWIEYVIRHNGARHLHAKTLPWWQLVYLDVILFLTLILTVALILVIKVIKKIVFCLQRTKEKSE